LMTKQIISHGWLFSFKPSNVKRKSQIMSKEHFHNPKTHRDSHIAERRSNERSKGSIFPRDSYLSSSFCFSVMAIFGQFPILPPSCS